MSCSGVSAVHTCLLSPTGCVSWPDLQHSQLVQHVSAAQRHRVEASNTHFALLALCRMSCVVLLLHRHPNIVVQTFTTVAVCRTN